jgi:N-acetylmuramoyl-L-alanine amidase
MHNNNPLTTFAQLVFVAFTVVLSLALPKSVSASPTEVHLIVGGRSALFEVPPYLDSNGTIMAPVDFVRLLGANYVEGPGNSVIVTSASGKSYTVQFQHVSDRLMIPLEPISVALGASTTWSPSTNTETLRSKLEVARVDGDSFVIATSYPIYYKTQTLDNPSRLVVDIFGADLDAPPSTIPADDPNVSQIRSGQLDDETVRLVLDLQHPIQYQVASSLQTDTIKLALNTDVTTTTPVPVIDSAPTAPKPVETVSTSTSTASIQPRVPSNTIVPTSGDVPTAPASPSKIVDVEYKAVNSEVSQVIVTTSGPANVGTDSYRSFLLPNPNRLAFEVSNSTLSVAGAVDETLGSLVPDANPLFKTIRWGLVNYPNQSAGRIVLDLLKPVIYTVTTENLDDNSGVRYIINIQQSAAVDYTGSNSIAGKIVIVDAGHGGKDTGAPGRPGIYEKNFALAIAKQVRDALIAAGATPIMTRSDDTFIPLDARSQLGIDAHADYFISIHCDSSGVQNSHSGDMVYYHGDDPTCRALAKSIANRLGQLEIAIQSDGVRSDYVRFPGIGYSVLRKSPETAVLVECGFVNNDADASCLADSGSQQQLATGIVAGLRDFVANQ